MRRAFSLIELAVASAMAGIISIAAIGAFAGLNRQLVLLQSESVASDNAKSLIDLMVSDLQGVGGGPIRPWMALWVEDGATPSTRTDTFAPPLPATGVRPDRVTFASLIANAPTCRVTAINGNSVASTGTGTSCCLSTLLANGNIRGRPDKAHAYVLAGARHRQISLSELEPTTCTAKWAAGPLAPIDVNPEGIGHFVDGTIVAARIKTVFLTRTRDLMEFEEKDGFDGGNVTLSRGEVSRIASDVYDFQVQLGFDLELDGRITDTGSATDEWLFNAATDTASSFAPEAIRMVGVGVVVGVPLTDPDYQSSAQIVGGTTIRGSRLYLRGAMGKAALRNLFIFF
jgi:type II secretory pathway pseudopilin PulG